MKKRHIFILNPAAGQGEATKIKNSILEVGNDLGLDVEIYETKESIDAEVFVRNIVENATKNNPIRIYACGGDGTINEVLNGMVDAENVELGAMPLGTGNDFVRNFTDNTDFMDIKSQLLGKSEKIDIIKYKRYINNFTDERYCINMFNIGFDCNVVVAAARFKKIPFISGSMAYLMGVINMLIKMKGAELTIEFESGEKVNKKILLIAIANGCFCGGGVKGVPKALVNDGLIDISIINKCSRSKFVKLFPKYVKGEHLSSKEAEYLCDYRHERKLIVSANRDTLLFSTDGEITEAEKLEFEVVDNAIDFIVPYKEL